MYKIISVFVCLLLVSCATKPIEPIIISYTSPMTGEIFTTKTLVPAKVRIKEGGIEFETDTRPIAPVYKSSGIVEQIVTSTAAIAIPVIVAKEL